MFDFHTLSFKIICIFCDGEDVQCTASLGKIRMFLNNFMIIDLGPKYKCFLSSGADDL